MTVAALRSLVGLRYVPGGRDIACGVDCWGFVLHAFRSRGINLPAFPGLDAECVRSVSEKLTEGERGEEWLRLDAPEDGCLVAMSKGRVFHHVGIWDADAGQVLHAVPTFGIIGHKLTALRCRSFKRIEFYRYIG